MATLPRATNKSIIFQRPTSNFDSGINSSTAWTESQHPSAPAAPASRKYLSESNIRENQSLSDDEIDDSEDGDEITRKARALYDFQGKAEFRELDVEAGDAIQVIKDDVGEGWSLVRNDAGEMGLLPQTYYTFTSELMPAPGLEIDDSPNAKQYPKHAAREASGTSITPRGSLRESHAVVPPIVPQNTGEWQAFPSFRQSLLGGKSLNRFSAFVTSGAEEFVLKGSTKQSEDYGLSSRASHSKEDSSNSLDEEDQRRLSRIESERHVVDPGPSWQEKVAPFRVMVHSPSKRTSLRSGAFTVYNVTSLFHAPVDNPDSDPQPEPETPSQESVARVTVLRRFSHFVILHTALTRRLPGIALPPLPEKQYAGRFSNDFVEARRGDLERYLNKIVRHPIARYAEILTFFLGCESDSEWKRCLPEHLAMPPAGPSFYARVDHPAFNVDAEDAQDSIGLFEAHTKAVGRGVQDLRSVFSRIRDARVEMSKAERLLSYILLSLITSRPLNSRSTGDPDEVQGNSTQTQAESKGLMNEEGAWCWRDKCNSCLKLTKAMQKTSEALQSVADLYDDHARRTQLATHESLKTMAHPSAIYEGVITTHRSSLSLYNDAVYGNQPDEDVAARCETVLNITMAEMDAYHAQKFEDTRTIAVEHLDGEIQFYEQVLSRLRAAKRNFEQPQFEELGTTPRQPSIYERDLDHPKLDSKPLTQPCPHVYDSAPMRPVSVAIQEGVSMLLGNRGSVFGKFW
ncbi:hypothetical protein FA15DRAFT_637246 [Coprinopsis marcescibilis]|uniref:PX-domain-containing protein n=1 Tax=Coprinopsis marcescibilis TaxID=230819 RepID=A0A5C3L1A4_COPMA|nr:hypothetical protein FA15DRAFT_637246 [Coprinopsis marcescibilis]